MDLNCLGFSEDCTNGIDDDGNGLVDCDDFVCILDPTCSSSGSEDCVNGVDDDADGDIDCDDSDCLLDPNCFVIGAGESDCQDGIDNDGNGQIDCADWSCALDPICTGSNGGGSSPTGVENCIDTMDNNGDGFVDCDDPGCVDYPHCYESNCQDGIDQDGDLLVDCNDPDCSAFCYESVCSDSIDDDYDGLLDCDDPDCSGSIECGESDCFDGVDNENDFYTDCFDSECYREPTCLTFSYDGTYAVNVVLEDNGSPWCSGIMSVNLVTNGYNHAQVSGSGDCFLSNGAAVNLSLGGDAFEINPTTVDIYGRVVHMSPNGDVSYGYLNLSTLTYDTQTLSTTVSLSWDVDMPVFGILLPLTATAN